MTSDFYVIIADGEVDQIAQGERNMRREVRDLTRMGCAVLTLGPVSGAKADDLQQHAEQGASFAKLRRLAKEG
jgi:hypothetical protein